MLSFNAGAIYKNKLYSITNIECFPIVLDLEEKSISYLKNISNYNCKLVPFGLENAVNVNDEIYFFGLDGDAVAIYNITTNSCEKIDIKCHVKDWGNFAVITQEKEYIIVFSSYEAKLVKINTKTHDVSYEGKIYHRLLQGAEEKIFSCGCRVNNAMWLFGKNKVAVEYDLAIGTYKEHILPVKMQECIDVVYRDDALYLLDISGQVIRWNLQDNSIKVLMDKPNGEFPFGRMLVVCQNIWLLPSLGSDIYIIDCKTEDVTIYQSYPEDFEYVGVSEWSKYHGYCEDMNKYYWAMRSTEYMLSIDKRTGEAQWLKVKIPTAREYFLQCAKRKIIIYENDYGLRNYITNV